LELVNDVLEEVFGQIPKNMKLAIVSIAGAMRSGKSFFLDLSLRYLRYTSDGRQILKDNSNEEWKNWVYEGINGHSDILEGRSNTQETNTHNGFSWRSGIDRNTTGMWIWDKPFYRKSKTGETIAVFLVDTQGLFDFESSQMLTTRIFGLSALLSSYQIYNVDKLVHENNLQHLAMFVEYGRYDYIQLLCILCG
jgi:atlastin